MVPAIYKAYKENYKIIFQTVRLPYGLYKKRNAEGDEEAIFEIDLEKEVLGSETQKEEFITAILYGANQDTKDKFRTNLGIILNTDGIYGIIKENQFKESLGVYYQEEVSAEEVDNSEDVPDVNKTKKRVITYTDI